MTRALSLLGDRMLAAVLPRASASACIPNDPYYTCKYKSSCSARFTTQYYCTNNCTGTEFCNPVGCCKTNTPS
jgi:hypothetical protein